MQGYYVIINAISFKWHNLKVKQLTSILIFTEHIYLCLCQISGFQGKYCLFRKSKMLLGKW